MRKMIIVMLVAPLVVGAGAARLVASPAPPIPGFLDFTLSSPTRLSPGSSFLIAGLLPEAAHLSLPGSAVYVLCDAAIAKSKPSGSGSALAGRTIRTVVRKFRFEDEVPRVATCGGRVPKAAAGERLFLRLYALGHFDGPYFADLKSVPIHSFIIPR
jgi:hypothetical protein